jgi:ATP-binding cassette subfamily B (MDR/TAP) protein 1
MSSSSDNGAGPEAGGKKKKKKAAEEEAAAAKVPFLKLFSFADRWDCVLMAVGSLGACAHGASVPVFFIFFGKLINIIGLAYLFPTTVSGRVAKVTAPARAWRI